MYQHTTPFIRARAIIRMLRVSTYQMPLHLLYLNFDGVEGFREQLGFLHDGYGHAAARVRIRQR
jgi:hypothetical protein